MEIKQFETKNKLDEGLTFKISRFKEQIKKTKPHKHDEYFELIFLSEGEGFHTIESEKYMVTVPDFYFLRPGQLHYWQFTSIPKGFVILFNKLEFDNVKESIILELNQKLSVTTRIKIQPDKYPGNLLNEIHNEFVVNTKYSKEIIHGLLKALLGKLLQECDSSEHKMETSPSIYDKFQDLLIKKCPLLHKVNEFAELLNITPQNLNSICRKHVNKSASSIITLQLMLEAKRYLLHTDKTINEITDILLFSDTSNFVKFFKKYEGITPANFRSQYFQ